MRTVDALSARSCELVYKLYEESFCWIVSA
jgi:hypothetical protein